MSLETVAEALWRGLYEAAAMFWEVLWALVFGFALSALMQVFVSKERMEREFGQANLRTVGLAVLFGGASSSCSFAAAAAAKSAFQKGAAFVPSVAFMFASTNLVIELGAIMWLLLGPRFVLAEAVGALVLVGVMWGIVALTYPRQLIEEGRHHAVAGEAPAEHCHDSGSAASSHWRSAEAWSAVGQAFVMDWRMVARDIGIGFVIAGYLAAFVPNSFWNRLFLHGHPGPWQTIENAIVGPLVAAAAFVCSIGNVPLASVLWTGGISFGGVIAFIYADLITIPLVFVYARYYGPRMAAYLVAVLFASMVVSALLVEQIFAFLRITPTARAASPVTHAHFAWNSTTWFDLVALALAGWLVALSRRSGGAGG